MTALRQRLERLRGAPAPAGGAGDLAARIERLRLRRSRPREASARDDRRLAEAVGGRVVADGVIRIDAAMAPERPMPQLSPAWAGPAAGVDPGRLLFLDTETTGLAGGSGTLVFLLGLARFGADGRLRLRQYLLTRFSGERAMLAEAAEWTGRDTVLVSYNGKGFDLPLLAARYRLAGLPDPLGGLPHLDLLYPVRRAFGGCWPDCRLQTAERRLLGFERPDDLPGSAAPGAWLGWLRRGEHAPLGGVCRHNRDDVHALARMLPVLERAYRDPRRYGADPAAVARALGRVEEPARVRLRSPQVARHASAPAIGATLPLF